MGFQNFRLRGEQALRLALGDLLVLALAKYPLQETQPAAQAVRDGPMWRFLVADNGIGVDPAQTERIFEVCKRLHTGGSYPGTGVGPC